MATLLTMSFYAIQYARFAWNPNSTPFWTILSLYGIHNIISQKNTNRAFWAIITGIAIGVGVQLHTTSLLLLPITTIIVFGFLFIKKINLFKYFFIILTISLFLNIPQFINEYQTGGKNIAEFFSGVNARKDSKNKLMRNVLQDSSCWVQSSVVTLSGYAISDGCTIKLTSKKTDWIIFLSGLVFAVGGLVIGIKYFLQEQDWNRKSFLILIFLYSGIAYLLFVPLAYEISMRFFLPLIFLPFILLGLWIKFLTDRLLGNYAYIPFLSIFILIATNIFFTLNYFADSKKIENGGLRQDIATIENVTLKEIEVISQFIINNSNKGGVAYIEGKKQYLRKSSNSIKFFVAKSDINLISINKDDTGLTKNSSSDQIFYLTSSKKKNKVLNEPLPPITYDSYGRFFIYLERN